MDSIAMRFLRQGIVCCLLGAILCCRADALSATQRKLPPPPGVPEVTTTLRREMLRELTNDDFHARERASNVLRQGSVDTIESLKQYVAGQEEWAATTEGKVRALQISQDVYLRLLRWQLDDDALRVRGLIDEIRLADDALLGPRLDTFHVTHSALMERASIRSLVRLNAVMEFRKVPRYFPGISKQDFSTELPFHVFIGEDWLGEEKDLRHVELLLLLGESQFGNSRALYRIQGCPIPLEAFQDLAAGLPGVFVEERSRARLGIAANNPQFGDFLDWEVTQIHPGSSAAHAGLRTKDRIVRLEGEIIKTFRDLTVKLEAYKPADIVTLDVLRDQSVAREVSMQVPASLEEMGLKLDNNFQRFTIIQSVEKDSEAERLGLNHLLRIDRLNGQPVNGPDNFLLYYTRLKPGETMVLTVREFEQVPVTLRGWVGPYR